MPTTKQQFVLQFNTRSHSIPNHLMPSTILDLQQDPDDAHLLQVAMRIDDNLLVSAIKLFSPVAEETGGITVTMMTEVEIMRKFSRNRAEDIAEWLQNEDNYYSTPLKEWTIFKKAHCPDFAVA